MASKSRSTVLEYEETYVVIPPDGGWGWVVVLASFLCMILVDGIINTFGIFIEDISVSIDADRTHVALANSLMSGCALLFAPFLGALMNRFGFRAIGVAGGLLISGVFIATAYCNNLGVLLGVYGVLGGIAMGLLFISALAIVGFYFERWRALATSLAVSGSCVGTLLMSPIMNIFLSEYDWRFKFQVLGIFSLSTCIASLTFRPIPPTRVVPLDASDINTLGSSSRVEKLSISTHHNLRYSTISEVYRKSITIPMRRNESSISSLIESVDESSTSMKFKDGGSIRSRAYAESKARRCLRCLRCCRSRCCTHQSSPPIRPLYRDDIFYQGSLAKLPQYSRSFLPSTSQKPVDYHLSVTRVLSQREIEEQNACRVCGEAVTRVLATMLDISLLKLLSFNLLCISGFITILGVYTPYCFLEQTAEERGVSHDMAIYLLTVLGAANLFGRVFCGLISCVNVDVILFLYVSLIIGGLATISVVSCRSFSAFFSFAIIFGFFLASMPTLRSIVICDLLGLEHLTNALGLNLMLQGVSSIIGLPFSTYLFTKTGSYDASFIFAGTCIVLSGLLLIPLQRIRRWELKREEIKEAARLAEQQRRLEIINRPYRSPKTARDKTKNTK